MSGRAAARRVSFVPARGGVAAQMERAMAGVYLHLFHGRNAVNEPCEGWGFDGPVIGPLNYVHTLSRTGKLKLGCSWQVADIFFAARAEHLRHAYPGLMLYPFEHSLDTVDAMLVHDGKYYGDWSVFGPELLAPAGIEVAQQAASVRD